MIGLFLHPAVLMVIMWLVARHNAELNFLTALLVILGVSFCSALLGIVHPLASLLGFLIIFPLALIRFCYTSLGQSLVIMGIFIAWLIAYNLFWILLLT